jgi:glyoxylase-like metal-dependent hydrolase (beta-lactamase superfamily II)
VRAGGAAVRARVCRRAALIAGLAAGVAGPLRAAPAAPRPRVTEVAAGILLFQTPPYSDVGLDGNAVAILTPDGVLVFDANGTPAAAGAVLREIRRRTRQPVRYLVYSHWHWDHWYGAEVYRNAFPGVTIIAHEATRRLMLGPALEFNRPGLETQLPAHIAAVAAALGRAAPGSGEARSLAAHAAADRAFLEAKRTVHHTFPDLTFTDSLVIHLGGREIRVLHYDRAVTPGDAFLYLPVEGVVVSGDLVVNPVPFALGCYPSGWLATLERIRALRWHLLIPGHGDPLRDPALLDAHIALFGDLLRLGREALGRGLGVANADSLAAPTVAAIRAQLTGGDRSLGRQFDLYAVDWFLHRVYDEASGPLSDSIPPIPPE